MNIKQHYKYLQVFLEDFEEKYKDKGDERYGISKHNNTVLINQIDDIRDFIYYSHTSLLEKIASEEIERLEKQVKDCPAHWEMDCDYCITCSKQITGGKHHYEYAQALQDQIQHWKEVLTELDKKE